MQEHRREVLREASIALQVRAVTLWEVSSRAEVIPVMTTAPTSQSGDTRLDLDSTLHRWGAPIIQGSRWVGCRLDDAGAWCIAPVRKQPAAPPPDGVERRSRERVTLELAGLCLGLVDQPPVVSRPRLPEPDALAELARQDRKSTRLNSSHPSISYAVFCLKKKKKTNTIKCLQKKKTATRQNG